MRLFYAWRLGYTQSMGDDNSLSSRKPSNPVQPLPSILPGTARGLRNRDRCVNLTPEITFLTKYGSRPVGSPKPLKADAKSESR